jgi:hypothetical protein
MDVEVRLRLSFIPIDFDQFVAQVADEIDSASVISQLDGICFVSVSSDLMSAETDPLPAVLALVSRVEKLGVIVDDVDDDLVDLSEIASRVGRSRETVRLWSLGRRGEGGFPVASGLLPGSLKIWEWDAVNRWLKVHHPTLADDVQLLSRLDRAKLRVHRALPTEAKKQAA